MTCFFWVTWMNWVTPAVLNDLTEGIHNLRSPKSPLPSQTHFQLIQVNHTMSDLDDLGACVPECLGDLDDLRVQGNLDDLSNLDVLDDLGTQTLSSTWSPPPPAQKHTFRSPRLSRSPTSATSPRTQRLSRSSMSPRSPRSPGFYRSRRSPRSSG